MEREELSKPAPLAPLTLRVPWGAGGCPLPSSPPQRRRALLGPRSRPGSMPQCQPGFLCSPNLYWACKRARYCRSACRQPMQPGVPSPHRPWWAPGDDHHGQGSSACPPGSCHRHPLPITQKNPSGRKKLCSRLLRAQRWLLPWGEKHTEILGAGGNHHNLPALPCQLPKRPKIQT